MSRAWEPTDRGGVHSGEKRARPDAADLIDRIRRGDGEAFEQLARDVGPRLYRLAMQLTRRREDAEDLVQETLVRALPALARFEGRARLSTYLIRALTNLWKNRLRSRSRSRIVQRTPVRDEQGGEQDPLEQAKDPAPSPEASLARRQRTEAMYSAVEQLSPDRKLALLLREVEGLSYEEIAEMTGVPVGTVRSRLARARDDVRRRLAEGDGR